MFRNLFDVKYPSGQVGWPLTNTGSAFQTIETLDPIDANPIDNRAFQAPNIPIGTLFKEQFSAADTGDGYYIPSEVAVQAIPFLSYGVLTSVPVSSNPQPNAALAPNVSQGGNEARIRQKGFCQALCVTPSSAVAIAPGTFLCADGNGNLQPFQPPSAAPTPTVTPEGTTGATSYSYKLAAVSVDGVATVLGTAGSTTTGNATLSVSNYNQISWTPVADAAYYIVVRTVGGAAQGVIGIVPNDVVVFNDVGQTPAENTSATVYFPTLSAPGAPTVAQVAGAVAGTTTYTYKVTAIGPNGVWSAESSATSLTTSNAVLSVANGNKITWTAVAGAAYYAIDRTAAGGTPSTTGFIGFANSPTAGFIDYGQAATTFTAVTVPTPTPRAGTVLAIAKGTLAAGTTTATLTPVSVGGF